MEYAAKCHAKQFLGAALMVAETLTARATVNANDKSRGKLLEECVRSYESFIAKYPGSKWRAEALRGKAIALFRMKNSDDAEKALRESLIQSSNSSLFIEYKELPSEVFH